MDAGTTSAPNRRQGRNWAAWALGALSAVLLIVVLWTAFRVFSIERTTQQRLQSARAEAAAQVTSARTESAMKVARAFAAGIQPILALRGQVPEITDRTVQQATEALIREGDYRLVQVIDRSGLVVASSDLASVGRRGAAGPTDPAGVEVVDDSVQAVTPIGEGRLRYGSVLVRIRP
jgi:hypothetical protein